MHDVDIFRIIPFEIRCQLARNCRRRRCRRNEVVFEQGDNGDCAIIVIEGRVQMTVTTSAGPSAWSVSNQVSKFKKVISLANYQNSYLTFGQWPNAPTTACTTRHFPQSPHTPGTSIHYLCLPRHMIPFDRSVEGSQCIG
jgi:CRP-like cAMP-binding protein